MLSKSDYQRGKETSNLISLFVINTLVLFLLSVTVFVYIQSSSIENYFKENILVSIYLKNSSSDSERKQLTKFLKLNEDIKESDFIPKEIAAESFTKEIGEEFVDFLGYNPLLDIITVKLFGDKIDVYNIEEFIDSLNNFVIIEEIVYDKPLVETLVKNFERIGLWIIIVSILFFVISFSLINNSIKISINSKRNTIRTMQLVGATKKFIRRPFILNYMKIGLFSSMLSIIVLFILINQFSAQLNEINFFSNINDILILILFVVSFGILTSFVSSYFITQKYLKLKITR